MLRGVGMMGVKPRGHPEEERGRRGPKDAGTARARCRPQQEAGRAGRCPWRGPLGPGAAGVYGWLPPAHRPHEAGPGPGLGYVLA